MTRPLVVILAVVLVVCACGGETDPTAEWPTELPVETAGLAAVFDPMLAPYGYRITRAALVERSTYVQTPAGDHLAVYAAPSAYLTADEYAEDFPKLIRVFLPHVFERWPQLQSFDICQEPQPSSRTVAASLTIFDVSRSAVDDVDWADLDLLDAIRLGDRPGVSVYARPVVAASPTWMAASVRSH